MNDLCEKSINRLNSKVKIISPTMTFQRELLLFTLKDDLKSSHPTFAENSLYEGV